MRLERELGEVVGELKGINVQLGDLKAGQKSTDERLGRLEQTLARLERSSSNWRWLERAGMLIGAAFAGFLSGRGAQG